MASELPLLRAPDIACWFCRREIEESAACRVVTFPVGEESDAVVSPVGHRAASVREEEGGEREEVPVFVVPSSVPVSLPVSTPNRGPVPVQVTTTVGEVPEKGAERGVKEGPETETEVGPEKETEPGTAERAEKRIAVGTKPGVKRKTSACDNDKEVVKEFSGPVYQNGLWTFRVHAGCWGTFSPFIYFLP